MRRAEDWLRRAPSVLFIAAIGCFALPFSSVTSSADPHVDLYTGAKVVVLPFTMQLEGQAAELVEGQQVLSRGPQAALVAAALASLLGVVLRARLWRLLASLMALAGVVSLLHMKSTLEQFGRSLTDDRVTLSVEHGVWLAITALAAGGLMSAYLFLRSRESAGEPAPSRENAGDEQSRPAGARPPMRRHAGAAHVLSSWHTLVENFQTSALDFYTAVEQALAARKVPNTTLSRVAFKEGGFGTAAREYLRVKRRNVAFDICAAPYGTGFFFSWWLVRLGPPHPFLWLLAFFAGGPLVFLFLLWSLRGSLDGMVSFIIATPFALWAFGYAIRQGVAPIDEEDVMGLPIIGWLYDRLFAPTTYYHLDTALMFRESVRRAVNEVLDTTLSAQGVRALSEEEKKPTLRELGSRR